MSCSPSRWYIIWKVKSINRVLDLKGTFSTICLTGSGFHARLVFFFNTFSGDLYLDVLKILLDLPSYGSDSWRRYTLKGACWWTEWGWGVSLAWGTVGRRKLCIIPCHNCHIYGTCLSKTVGGGFIGMIWG